MEEQNTQIVQQVKPGKHYVLGHPILWCIIAMPLISFLAQIIGSLFSQILCGSSAEGAVSDFLAGVIFLAVYSGLALLLLRTARNSYGSSFHIGLAKKDFKRSLILTLPAIVYVALNIIPNAIEHVPHESGLLPILTILINSFAFGFGEELVSRNFVLENAMQCWKRKPYRIKATLIVSAIGFGVLHLLNLANGHSQLGPVILQMFCAIAMGFFFAAIYMRTRNIWGPVIIHWLIDASSFYFSGSDDTANLELAPLIIIIVLSAAMVAIGCYLVRGSKMQEIEELWADEEDTLVRKNSKAGKVIKRAVLIVLAVLIVILTAVIGNGILSGKKTADTAGANFTGYEMTSLDETDIKNKIDLSKGKITVINMWATTCVPCIEEMPSLEAVSKQYEGDVQMIGVCADTLKDGKINDSKVTDAKDIVKTTGVTYQQLLPSEDMDELIQGIFAYPYTIIFDKDGNVLKTISGGKEEEQWRSIIEGCLEEVK